MPIPNWIILGIIILTSNKAYSSDDKNEENEIIKSAEVKFDIIGDTSHLFAPEDFEKKEVILLHNSTTNQTTEPQKLKSNHPECLKKNSTNLLVPNSVKLVNGLKLTQILYDSQINECFFVLFYVPWCPFSAKLAPIFNALPRAFSNLDFLAFDVSKSIGYNTKFGTSAVPMLILFQQRNIISKFNFTDKNLLDFIEFVSNKTGFEGDKSVHLNETDFEGPVPTVPIIGPDYYLWLAWAFLIFVSFDFLIRKTNLKIQICRMIRYFILFFRPIRLIELDEPIRLPAIQNANQNNAHPHSD
ncbi:unnamed protein product [Brachionus calyciflorus]|uniref:Thioredoxin domain-containing protein n=1 Tax=Brachionus calyciflorus TaxID=104777 RepID=A0A813SW49_9BILA|nr:unnamed protein product [Brachionus calyciflorus]